MLAELNTEVEPLQVTSVCFRPCVSPNWEPLYIHTYYTVHSHPHMKWNTVRIVITTVLTELTGLDHFQLQSDFGGAISVHTLVWNQVLPLEIFCLCAWSRETWLEYELVWFFNRLFLYCCSYFLFSYHWGLDVLKQLV